MVENEYIDGEKVWYKVRCNVELPNNRIEEADCIVTENHVLIKTQEPIKIHVSQIQECIVPTLTTTSLYSGSIRTQEQLHDTSTLVFFDDLSQKQNLSLVLPAGGVPRPVDNLKQAINRQKVGKFTDIIDKPSRNIMRDKTRENVCISLQRLGIDAQLVPRGRVEEEITGYISALAMGSSLGIIRILEGNIRWVDVRRDKDTLSDKTTYFTNYGIPDPKLGPDYPMSLIRTKRVKSSPLVGRVVDLRWEGEDFSLNIISRLNNDYQLRGPIMNSGDVSISAIGEYGCWIISTYTRDTPSRELWDCYR